MFISVPIYLKTNSFCTHGKNYNKKVNDFLAVCKCSRLFLNFDAGTFLTHVWLSAKYDIPLDQQANDVLITPDWKIITGYTLTIDRYSAKFFLQIWRWLNYLLSKEIKWYLWFINTIILKKATETWQYFKQQQNVELENFFEKALRYSLIRRNNNRYNWQLCYDHTIILYSRCLKMIHFSALLSSWSSFWEMTIRIKLDITRKPIPQIRFCKLIFLNDTY